MTITTVQKVIKIGSSKGVTIPAKDLRALGIEAGTDVKVTVERIKSVPSKNQNLQKEYDQFVAQYSETLKNLRDR